RRAGVGEYLIAGTPVATLVRVHPIRLALAIPERAAVSVHVGQDVMVTVEGDPTTYRGRVVRLSPSIQEQNRTLTIEAEVPNERGVLRPGSFAKAEIVMGTDQPAVFVPTSSIVVFAGIEKVLSVKDGRSLEKRVTTGRKEKDQVEIVEGITAGEPVIVEPGNLVGGQPVAIVSQRCWEEAVTTTQATTELRSISSPSNSLPTVTFDLKRNIDVAAQDVRDKVAIAIRNLPRDIKAPIIAKTDNDQTPVLTVAIVGNRSLRELTEIADKTVKVELERSSGVGDVRIVGGLLRAVNVWVDADRLAAYQIPITAVRDAVVRQNADL